jgi:hypothetical protein
MLRFGPEPSVVSSASKNVKIIIYKTVILPVVLCWCETWSLTLGEERRLRVSRHGRVEKTYNEELRNLYPSPSAIRITKSMRMRWPRHVAWEKCPTYVIARKI